ncbi:MAG TPA: cupin domain-containing protein [Acidimicrobiales bacterium]|nr:cupin domain-containing protein [Acidimicrobiales bacterium]
MEEQEAVWRKGVIAASVVVASTVLGVVVAHATPSSGSTSVVIGRGVVGEEVKVNADPIKVTSKGPFEVIAQTVTFQPGGTSGWHSHPGPVFVVVKSGTVTVYDSTCVPRRYSAGEGFIEGPEPAVIRNEGETVSENVATLLVPSGSPPRMDASSPCPGNV